jgi:hypothetical protein
MLWTYRNDVGGHEARSGSQLSLAANISRLLAEQQLCSFYSFILHYDQQMHNYFTNYHTATCFDTIVSSSACNQYLAKLHKYFKYSCL